MEVVCLVLHIQFGLSYRCNPYVGVSCMRVLWELIIPAYIRITLVRQSKLYMHPYVGVSCMRLLWEFIIPAYRRITLVRQSQLYMQPPSKQLPRTIITTLDRSQPFYRVYFIINYKYFNLLNLLTFIILMIFVTLEK